MPLGARRKQRTPKLNRMRLLWRLLSFISLEMYVWECCSYSFCVYRPNYHSLLFLLWSFVRCKLIVACVFVYSAFTFLSLCVCGECWFVSLSIQYIADWQQRYTTSTTYNKHMVGLWTKSTSSNTKYNALGNLLNDKVGCVLKSLYQLVNIVILFNCPLEGGE